MSGAATRAAAARAVAAVISRGRALPEALAEHSAKLENPADQAFAQHLAYAALRWRFRSEWLLKRLLKKPVKKGAADLHGLFLVAIEEVRTDPQRAHAIVNEAVSASRLIRASWASGLVNGVLRRLLREHEQLQQELCGDEPARTAHPEWLLNRFKQDWPEDWQKICTENNKAPPLWLRVNEARLSRSEYMTRLAEADIAATASDEAPQAIRLAEPQSVHGLPGFDSGQLSVQDAAAQLAHQVLAPEPGMRILDACAAPGGKAAHVLERTDDIQLTAVEIDASRAPRITENLQRLGLGATVKIADASDPDSWWDGQPFDRILVDAPCSATGVIRRHPDIKSLRRESDINALKDLQGEILNALWPLLKPGGMLVYATCSVLKEENEYQLEAFLRRQSQAVCQFFEADWGRNVELGNGVFGRQILPGEADMDGFFYARLVHHAADGLPAR